MKPYIQLSIVICAVLAGCAAPEDVGTPPPPPMSQNQVQTNIEKIQNNPEMSAESKERAIAGIKSAAAMQQAAAAAAAQNSAGSKSK